MLSSGLWAPALIGILCLFRRVRQYVGNQQGYIFRRAGFVFPLGLAVPAVGSFLFVFYFLGCLCVFFLLLFCRCVRLYYVVGSSGCGSPRIQCFTVPCKFSSGCCVGQQSTQYFRQVFLRLLMTEAKTASPLESAVHSIAWFYQLDGEPSPSAHPLEYSCRCAEFAGPSNNQEGTYHRLSVRAVSCLQGGLNGLFV